MSTAKHRTEIRDAYLMGVREGRDDIHEDHELDSIVNLEGELEIDIQEGGYCASRVWIGGKCVAGEIEGALGRRDQDQSRYTDEPIEGKFRLILMRIDE